MSGEASGLKKERKKVLFNAFLLASGTMTSRILGLLRDMALAAFFDRSVTDAWAAAFRIPNLFRRLFGEGSLSVSFIPVFTETRIADPTGVKTQNMVNAFYSLFLVGMGTLATALILFADPLMKGLLSPQYVQDTAQFNMTVRMAQLMLGFVFFVCTSACFAGVLNALGAFGAAAFAPTLFNISMLIFTFLPNSWFAVHGDGLAWGVLVGGALQALFLAMALKARGFLPSFSWHWGNEDVRRIWKGLLPGLVGLGLLQFTTLVNLHFASGLGEGAISAIYWADRLLEFPLSLVAVSLGVALLPRLSELWVQKQEKELAKTLEDHLLVNIYLAIPAGVGLWMLAEPIVRVLFQRGQFVDQDVATTSSVLQIYGGLLIFVAASRVVVVAFYAVQKLFYPAFSVLASLVAHVILAPQLMALYGLRGLVLSSLVTSALGFLFLMIPLKKRVVDISYRRLAREMLRMALAALGMVLVLRLFARDEIKTLGLSASIGAGALTYILLSFCLGIKQVQSTFGALWTKILSKISETKN